MEDGLFGLALSPMRQSNDRTLVYRPLASRSIYAAPVSDIKSSRRIGEQLRHFHAGRNFLPSQASTMAFSAGGTLFYGLTGQTAVGCWHMDNPWSPEYFVS